MKQTYDTEAEAEALEESVEEARNLAHKLGLSPYDVKYWIVDHDEMNELIAYGGFQERYPHWRWGMKYDHQEKKGKLGMGKAFEIVNNDDPSNAFLQVSNDLADQKAVITHVEAHADFFANNEWFGMFDDERGGSIDATGMLERHADRIESYMKDPEIDRDDVERFIDSVSCLEDTIDQHEPYTPITDEAIIEETDVANLDERIDALGVMDEVEGHVFNDDWREEQANSGDEYSDETKDVLEFLITHGKEFDEDDERAVEMPAWKRDILRMLRKEAYYFAPQKMTKVMNEGHAAYYESIMMADENFARPEEVVTYADHMSKVLSAGGLNPYSLGLQLWKYIENRTNRAEVIDQLLRVEGLSWRNLFSSIDTERVLEQLEPDDRIAAISSDSLDELRELCPDPRIDEGMLERAEAGEVDVDTYPWKVLTYEGMAERHYSLVKTGNRSFLTDLSRSDLEERARYIRDLDRYETVEEAIEAVDRTAGWDRMQDIRASHNDVTFLDEFLTEEFVRQNGLFAFEYSHVTDDYRVSSTEFHDVKKKLLLQFTNFGKPTIVALDHNFMNKNELLLGHQYNGVMLDMEQAMGVMKRLYELWGRPVNLATVVKDFEEADEDDAAVRMGVLEGGEPDVVEVAQRVRFDGEEFEFHPLEPEIQEQIEATSIDYSTVPESWK